MNISIENCEVNIITGTDTLEISGSTQPTATDPTRPAEYKESGFISVMTYSMDAFMATTSPIQPSSISFRQV